MRSVRCVSSWPMGDRAARLSALSIPAVGALTNTDHRWWDSVRIVEPVTSGGSRHQPRTAGGTSESRPPLAAHCSNLSPTQFYRLLIRLRAGFPCSWPSFDLGGLQCQTKRSFSLPSQSRMSVRGTSSRGSRCTRARHSSSLTCRSRNLTTATGRNEFAQGYGGPTASSPWLARILLCPADRSGRSSAPKTRLSRFEISGRTRMTALKSLASRHFLGVTQTSAASSILCRHHA